ncbi:MAG: hypothetical protein ABFE13_13360 [Phycisphaerales bacterium]
MSSEYWAGVATLLIGWSLKELSDKLRLRREERKPFARAIADLLEMRHRLLSVSTALAEIKKHLPIAPDAEVALRTFFHSVFPQAEDLQRRYNEAVSLVAGVDPILAFRLRSKDEFLPFMQRLRPLLTAANSPRPFVVEIDDKLSRSFIEDLEELTMELAKAHGMVSWWRIRKRLSKPQSLPKQADELLLLLGKGQQPDTQAP